MGYEVVRSKSGVVSFPVSCPLLLLTLDPTLSHRTDIPTGLQSGSLGREFQKKTKQLCFLHLLRSPLPLHFLLGLMEMGDPNEETQESLLCPFYLPSSSWPRCQQSPPCDTETHSHIHTHLHCRSIVRCACVCRTGVIRAPVEKFENI